MCAREHPSDDDRQRPRGLADALSRWDTEQGWMRLDAGSRGGQHGARAAARVDAGPVLPAGRPPPPRAAAAVDSWDAVVCARAAGAAVRRSRGPRPPSPSRSCGPRPSTRSTAGSGPSTQASPSAGLPKPMPPAPGGGPARPVARRRRNQRAGGLRWVELRGRRAGGCPPVRGCRRGSAAGSDEPECCACRFRARVRTWRDRAAGFDWTGSSWMADAGSTLSGPAARRHGSGPAARTRLRRGVGQRRRTAARRLVRFLGSDARAASAGRDDSGEAGSDEVAEAMSRWSADGSARGGRELTDDEWLSHLKGDGNRGSPLWTPWAASPPWSAPDRPSAEPAPAGTSPAPLPPPAASPQWTMGPTSGAHPVAARTCGVRPIRPATTADLSRR